MGLEVVGLEVVGLVVFDFADFELVGLEVGRSVPEHASSEACTSSFCTNHTRHEEKRCISNEANQSRKELTKTTHPIASPSLNVGTPQSLLYQIEMVFVTTSYAAFLPINNICIEPITSLGFWFCSLNERGRDEIPNSRISISNDVWFGW